MPCEAFFPPVFHFFCFSFSNNIYPIPVPVIVSATTYLGVYKLVSNNNANMLQSIADYLVDWAFARGTTTAVFIPEPK